METVCSVTCCTWTWILRHPLKMFHQWCLTWDSKMQSPLVSPADAFVLSLILTSNWKAHTLLQSPFKRTGDRVWKAPPYYGLRDYWPSHAQWCLSTQVWRMWRRRLVTLVLLMGTSMNRKENYRSNKVGFWLPGEGHFGQSVIDQASYVGNPGIGLRLSVLDSDGDRRICAVNSRLITS